MRRVCTFCRDIQYPSDNCCSKCDGVYGISCQPSRTRAFPLCSVSCVAGEAWKKKPPLRVLYWCAVVGVSCCVTDDLVLCGHEVDIRCLKYGKIYVRYISKSALSILVVLGVIYDSTWGHHVECVVAKVILTCRIVHKVGVNITQNGPKIWPTIVNPNSIPDLLNLFACVKNAFMNTRNMTIDLEMSWSTGRTPKEEQFIFSWSRLVGNNVVFFLYGLRSILLSWGRCINCC